MTVAILAQADAIVAAINGATLSQAVTAKRVYVPKFDLHTSSQYQVAVCPKSDSREPGGQSQDAAELLVDIGVMKKLEAFTTEDAEVTEIDAALEFCEELRHLVNRQRLTDVEAAICTRIEQNPIYSVEQLDESRVFLTVLTTTWATEIDV